MMRDIIGLRATLKDQLEEAVEVEAAAKEAYEEAVKNRERIAEFIDVIEVYRGGSERRNTARVYSAPVDYASMAAQREAVVTDILKGAGPLKSDAILTAIDEIGQIDLFWPDHARNRRLANLAVYLTRMHRRPDAPLVRDLDLKTFGLKVAE